MNQPNTATGIPTTTGVTVPPEVWAQMHQLLANFGPPNTIVPPLAPIITPLAPIVSSLSPSVDRAPRSITHSFKPRIPSDLPSQDEYHENQSLPSPDFEVTPANKDEIHRESSVLSNNNESLRESLVWSKNNYSTKDVPNDHTISDSAQHPGTITLALPGVITNLKDYNYSAGSKFPLTNIILIPMADLCSYH
jgi:hypothetical protein